jgi:stress response protein YsnF
LKPSTRSTTRATTHVRTPSRPAAADGAASPAARLVLPVVEEELTVGKRRIDKAKVRVRKVVRERVAVVDEPLVQEDAVVERVPVDRFVDGPVPPRQEGDTLVLSVVEEVLVKRLRLIEEIRITKRQTVARRPTKVPLRREEVFVERSSRW